ncbi:hypothetical protein WJX73_010793 [Symbiochloris irregularis]|uniref:Uncharacterized protein n=1 Tax=Symbiochloris irregularis TaxID=706552 RepID=A0AAW1P6T1_9CHLO
MPLSGAVFGAGIGLSVQLFSNGIRKVPLLRDPWEHVFFIGAGAYLGDWLGKYEARTSAEIEDILQKRADKNKNIKPLQSS